MTSTKLTEKEIHSKQYETVITYIMNANQQELLGILNAFNLKTQQILDSQQKKKSKIILN